MRATYGDGSVADDRIGGGPAAARSTAFIISDPGLEMTEDHEAQTQTSTWGDRRCTGSNQRQSKLEHESHNNRCVRRNTDTCTHRQRVSE